MSVALKNSKHYWISTMRNDTPTNAEIRELHGKHGAVFMSGQEFLSTYVLINLFNHTHEHRGVLLDRLEAAGAKIKT